VLREKSGKGLEKIHESFVRRLRNGNRGSYISQRGSDAFDPVSGGSALDQRTGRFRPWQMGSKRKKKVWERVVSSDALYSDSLGASGERSQRNGRDLGQDKRVLRGKSGKDMGNQKESPPRVRLTPSIAS